MERTEKKNNRKKYALLLLLLLLLLGAYVWMMVPGQGAEGTAQGMAEITDNQTPLADGNATDIQDNQTPLAGSAVTTAPQATASVQATPAVTPQANAPVVVPNENAVVVPTPETTPETIPEQTPETTPETTPEVTPEATPETTPEQTPDTAPETTPEVTPETTPETTPEVKPEPAMSNVERTLKAAQDLADRFNACTTLQEKRELLESSTAVGNDQMMAKIQKELGGSFLAYDGIGVDHMQNPVAGTLYVQPYFIDNGSGQYYVVLFASKNAQVAGNGRWETTMVYDHESKTWYEYVVKNQYNGKQEVFRMTSYGNIKISWSALKADLNNETKWAPIEENKEQFVPVQPAQQNVMRMTEAVEAPVEQETPETVLEETVNVEEQAQEEQNQDSQDEAPVEEEQVEETL